jgi:hydroxyacylglutathione hydrolase
VGGNLELKAAGAHEIVCSEFDRDRVPGATRFLRDGESAELGGVRLLAIAIPGHTLGHTAFFDPESASLFCGDTLFAFGAGRLFEGTAEQLRSSLAQIANRPGDTRLYFGHEYAARNAAFAQATVADPETQARAAAIAERLSLGEHGVPVPLADELRTNPFFRIEDPTYRARAGLAEMTALEAFTELRRRRDSW